MRVFVLAALLGLLAAPLAAGPVEDSIARQLRDQGFRGIKVERTFLGRVRITAQSQRLDREIIVNPATGEILRDYWEEREGGTRSGGIINPAPGQSTRDYDDKDEEDRDKDRDDDDRDDDDADVDNSGRGNASDRGDDDGDDDGDDGDSDSSGSGGNSGRGGGGDDDGDSDGDD